ncbi:class I SAM-dependent methyltransferase [Rugosimonospora africana]|uniref:S-adenosyl-L-methionine-dependent methyltransferase n=1 Tax=Rugosimonospora africana TaxID=556532 RepID=A0A8J3R3U3_9ACTN|nr:SAM-dependent methyltransferase [Rugosimonospora africana]GIH21218.1 S-adenosyl-L-methionine-dependent methyltransferase [Rugosimonospora africana]
MVVNTAYWIAAVRARESSRPDRLFDDPFARRLAGERGVAAMTASERASGGENTFIPVRVRWFDDAVLRAVADGYRQVVLLGAGLDTRPYRLDLPGDLDWYELDRPEVFDGKQPALAGTTPRCRRWTVAADLVGDWPAALTAAGFDPERRTVWLAEGLFFYLAEESVLGLLRTAAGLAAPDSRFLADIMSAAVRDLPSMRAYQEYRARHGIPEPYGCDDPAALLRSGGWYPEAITAPGAPDANYGRLPAAPGGVRPGRPHLVTGRTLPADAG